MKVGRSILFVCTGNICRSPTAEAVLRHLAARESIQLRVASAGLGDWHVGNPPDERARHHAGRRGYDLSARRSGSSPATATCPIRTTAAPKASSAFSTSWKSAAGRSSKS